MLITGYRRCRCPMGLSLSRGGDPWLPIATGLGFMFWSFFRVKLYNAHPPKEIPKGLKWPIFLGRGSTVFLVEVGEKKQIQWRSQIAGFLMLINHTLVLISNHLRGTLSSRPLLLICLFAVVLDYYLYIYIHMFFVLHMCWTWKEVWFCSKHIATCKIMQVPEVCPDFQLAVCIKSRCVSICHIDESHIYIYTYT